MLVPTLHTFYMSIFHLDSPLDKNLIIWCYPTAASFAPLHYKVRDCQGRFTWICSQCFWSYTKNERLGRCK